MSRYSYSLIQRVAVRDKPRDNASGPIDRFFSFDYMGSSEFEGNTMFKALQAMRAKRLDVVITEIEFRFRDIRSTAWAVCQPDLVPEVTEIFRDQLSESPQMRFKERTRIAEAYSKQLGSVTGWWCLDRGHEWILFRDKPAAEKWMRVL